jgi:hypothetical protein
MIWQAGIIPDGVTNGIGQTHPWLTISPFRSRTKLRDPLQSGRGWYYFQ